VYVLLSLVPACRHDRGYIRCDCVLQPEAEAPGFGQAADRLRPSVAYPAYAHARDQHRCRFQCYFP
jgi:hypothetical protein